MPDHVDAARLLRDKEELLVRERRKREELARSNEVKDRFIAALAHDLRAPINAILDWVQLLQRETLDTSTRRQVLTTIELNAATQVALIDELPDLSRIGSESAGLELSSLDLASTVERVIAGKLPAAEEARIDLHYEKPKDPRWSWVTEGGLARSSRTW